MIICKDSYDASVFVTYLKVTKFSDTLNLAI